MNLDRKDGEKRGSFCRDEAWGMGEWVRCNIGSVGAGGEERGGGRSVLKEILMEGALIAVSVEEVRWGVGGEKRKLINYRER